MNKLNMEEIRGVEPRCREIHLWDFCVSANHEWSVTAYGSGVGEPDFCLTIDEDDWGRVLVLANGEWCGIHPEYIEELLPNKPYVVPSTPVMDHTDLKLQHVWELNPLVNHPHVLMFCENWYWLEHEHQDRQHKLHLVAPYESMGDKEYADWWYDKGRALEWELSQVRKRTTGLHDNDPLWCWKEWVTCCGYNKLPRENAPNTIYGLTFEELVELCEGDFTPALRRKVGALLGLKLTAGGNITCATFLAAMQGRGYVVKEQQQRVVSIEKKED